MRMSTVYREIGKIRGERSVGPKYKKWLFDFKTSAISSMQLELSL